MARKRYVAGHNIALEQELGSDLPIWGVWDKQDEVWAVDNVSRHWNEAQVAASAAEAEFRRFEEDYQQTTEEADEDAWAAVESWLTTYYDAEHIRPYLACIRSQDDWKYIDVRADMFAGAQFEPGPKAYNEGIDFAMSALYECHGGPHIATCPNYITREMHDRDHVHKRHDCDFCEDEQRDDA